MCRAALPPQNSWVESFVLKEIVDDLLARQRLVEERALSFAENDLVHRSAIAQVFRGQYRDAPVAIKRFVSSATTGHSQEEAARWKKELAVLSAMGDHPHIVPFLGSCEDTAGQLILVTAWMEGGTVATLLQSSPPTALAVKLRLCHESAQGLAHLHEMGILHRDLKPANLCLDDRGRVRIIDFGCSVALRAGATMTNGIGTPTFMAPEMVMCEPYSLQADIFSLAMTAWVIFAEGAEPYPGLVPMQIGMAVCMQGRRPLLDASWPSYVQEVLGQGWQREPTARPSAKEFAQALAQCM